MLENPSVGVVACDARGTVREFSPTAERLLGYRAAAMKGSTAVRSLFHPDEVARELAALSREVAQPVIEFHEALRIRLGALQGGQERDWTLVRKDGTHFPARVALSPLRDRQGRYDGWLAIIRDVTERRAIEASAEEQKRQLEHFFRHAPAAVALLDRDLRYLAVSQRWIADHRLQETDLIGRAHLEVLPSAARRWREVYRRCLEGAIEHSEEDTVVLGDGSEETVRWECRPWQTRNGAVGGIALYSEILSESRRAERKLAESQAMLRAAQSLAHVGSWEFEPTARKLTWSEETYRIHEMDASVPLSLDQALAFFVPEHRPLVAGAVERSLRECTGWDLELQIQTMSRRRVWIRTIAQVEATEGRTVRLYGTLQDISERKAAEAAMTKAKDEAIDAARTKADFLANMSHEIRTPLNAVIGMTGLLLGTNLDDEQQECLRTVRTASDNLLELINDILDFSKIESGKLDLERQPYSFQECVETALELVAPRATEKRLELACWVDPSVPQILLGDVTRVRQVIVNLLTNAVKFTVQGEVAVSVDLLPGLTGERRLHGVVRDTGIGIPADRLDRLFQSFSQVDSSTTRTYGGTGLGLAISRRLVELMGGRIWVESEPGRGSRFHFELPLTLPDASEAAEVGGLDPSSIGARRILVVDDNATSRDILELLIVQWGGTAECVDSPVTALELVSRGERFDAVLVDHLMPAMNGVQFTRELRTITGPVEVPVILLTQLGQRHVTFADGPFVALLAKPVRPHQLSRALRQVFDSAPGADLAEIAAADWPMLGFLRVLVVEDNPVNQRVARALLERVNIRPDVAAHGGEALDALARQPYDVVIMDIQMPVMNGLDATREIRRRLPTDRQPVVIAMTASAMARDRETCLGAGMDDYIAKPVRAELLYARLDHWQKARAERGDGVLSSEAS